jgi:hypothetical protein
MLISHLFLCTIKKRPFEQPAQMAHKADSCTKSYKKSYIEGLDILTGLPLDWLFKMIRIYIGRRGVSWVEWSGVDVVSDAFKFRPWQDYSVVSIIRPGCLTCLTWLIQTLFYPWIEIVLIV